MTAAPAPARPASRSAATPALEITPNDPISMYFQSTPSVIELGKLNLDSPALRALKAAGMQLAVPLVSQGELVGIINLGPRLSEQDYSSDDHALLNTLATQAAPAVRVAQLVRQQQAEALARERMEQELRVARLIQQTLLPKEAPVLAGWQVAAYYQPAQAVGGDFYDFILLPDGRVGFVIGDVSDKGVPAALVMATTRTMLRATAQQLISPGEVLERVNDVLDPDIPPNMFVTCLYAILDPATGRLQYANAGHDLPYRRADSGVTELRATGMPLGLMPDMHYEEKEITLAAGDTILFYSDGLVEAHNPEHAMFSFPRLKTLMETHSGGVTLIDFLRGELADYTGPDWEQEDDVTLVILKRTSPPSQASSPLSPLLTTHQESGDTQGAGGEAWRTLAEFTVPSVPGNERQAMDQVAAAVQAQNLSGARLERLKTAVAEATMNAMEYGNKYRPELPVFIRVLASDNMLLVRITDQGGGQPIPAPETPDLAAKLDGLQTPRGWGLFLIQKMVDEMRVSSDEAHHTLELIMHLKGDQYARETS